MEGNGAGLNLARFAYQPSRKKPRVFLPEAVSPSELTSVNTYKLDTLVKSSSTTTSQFEAEARKNPRKRPLTGPKRVSRSQKFMETLQDVRIADKLREGLDIVIVGYNPGRFSASRGHNYAGPGNHFWPCLYRSGLLPEALTFQQDDRITEFGIGLTNIVSRPTAGSADLSKAELQEGATELRRKILEFRPKIVAFNGLGIYEAFSKSKNFELGKQEQCFQGTDIILYVMPSSSPRGSKWPRMEDKLKFYEGLTYLRDFVKGELEVLVEEKVVFPK